MGRNKGPAEHQRKRQGQRQTRRHREAKNAHASGRGREMQFRGQVRYEIQFRNEQITFSPSHGHGGTTMSEWAKTKSLPNINASVRQTTTVRGALR